MVISAKDITFRQVLEMNRDLEKYKYNRLAYQLINGKLYLLPKTREMWTNGEYK